jgi:citrate lyase subunit beta/citryl-CoA lyase
VITFDLPRSLLFVPGSEERRFPRAVESAADALIFDLEDAVPPDRKAEARERVGRELGVDSPKSVMVRINGPDTEWGGGDLEMLAEARVDAVVVPKADPASLAMLPRHGPPVIALVETAAGLLAAPELAADRRVVALMLGAADLGAELGLEPRADGFEIAYARSLLVVASAAAGIGPPIDVVHLDTRNEEPLRAEGELARSLGFGAKACIHPAQAPIVNEVFGVSAAQAAAAREVVDAFEEARAAGVAVATLRGQMIDLPVVVRARRSLARHEQQ